MNYEDLTTLGIALGLGMLVGLQREYSEHEIAGVRTFSLIAVLGCVAGFLTRDTDSPWVLPALGLSLAGLIMFARPRPEEKESPGKTTEVAVLLMFAVGAYLVLGDRIIGIVAGALIAILLFAKSHLHGFIEKLKDKEVSAIMTLAGISLIILPILPNQSYGPFDVLNPQNIWLMVVFIVGLNLTGYFVYKFVGKKSSILSNSILGGSISSTATTVSYARKQQKAPDIAGMATFVVTTASAVALLRILLEIFVVAPTELDALALPLIFNFFCLTVLCALLFYRFAIAKDAPELPEPKNPAEFKTALTFGILYGLVLLLVAFAEERLGDKGLYAVTIISGLTNVDAITLSLAQMIKENSITSTQGWRLILLASLANLVFKGAVVAVIGKKNLIKWVSISFGIAIAIGVLTILFWPENWHFSEMVELAE